MLKFFLALRPFLILTLMAGVYVFLPTQIPQQDKKSEESFQNESQTSSEDNLQNNEAPLDSLLADLFGLAAVDPSFRLPDNSSSVSQANASQPPQLEPARSIYLYLVQASDIGFKSDLSRLKLALATAETGETKTLDNLISELEAKLAVFQALVPPQELQKAHEASSQVLLKYVQLLKAARNKETGSVEKTWNGEKRQEITEEATRINQELHETVRLYDIVLPDGVLP